MRGFGLRWKITLALLLVGLVPLAVTTAILVRLNLDRFAKSAQEYRMAVAASAVQAVQATIEGVVAELEAVGGALAERGPSAIARERLATSLLKGARVLDAVAVYDRHGAFLDALEAGARAPGLPRPERLAADDRERLARGDVVVGEVGATADGGAAVPVTVPVFQVVEGEIGGRALWGHVRAAVRLDPLSEAIAATSRRRFTGEGNRVFVVDGALRVVAHAEPGSLLRSIRDRGIARGLPGDDAFLRDVDADYAAAYDADGEAVLGVLVPVPALGWGVVVEQPRADAYAGVRTTWQTSLGAGVVFAAFAILAGLLLGRRLARPVVDVAHAAERVAGGDFAVRVPERGRDEVGDMGRAFNRMASDLVQYRDDLVAETRVRTDLSRYLSPDVVDVVVNDPESMRLGGERREVTVLFADVVAFTRFAEKHPPEVVVGVLNELFTFLSGIVFRHGGIVDKFVGDSIMAVFGAPTARPDDPVRAVRAAEEMLDWLEVGNVKWQKELGVALQLGVGISTGEVVAGNLGSERRMDYTVIGDTVNLAARLESLARPGQILMTRATRDRLGPGFRCEHVATRTLAGRDEPTEVWSVLP